MTISSREIRLSGGPFFPRAVVLAGVLFCLVMLVATRIYLDGAREYDQAEMAFAAKNPQAAAHHYERAIRWYLPLSHHVIGAIQRLWTIGQQFEDQKQFESAQQIYLQLRSSLYAIHTIGSPFNGWIEKCNQKLQGTPLEHPTGVQPLPNDAWSLLACLFFWGWIITVIGLIRYRLAEPFNKKNISKWLSVIGLSYAAWAISLACA